MAAKTPLRIPGIEPIEGYHPVLIIGPNGAGKTQLGVEIARLNVGRRISALRHLVVPDELQMMSPETAQAEVQGAINNTLNQPWALSNEIGVLLSKLKAEDAQSAVEFRNKSFQEPYGQPSETNLTRLVAFWRKYFPGRTIDLSSYTPRTTSTLGNSPATYQISRMSDGERVAVYLAASILDAPLGVIVIDEPEVHLHPVLARRLWDAFEAMRPDCRFVYITHDLPFALSRDHPQFVIVKPGKPPEVLPRDIPIPDDVFESILGAASFSITARHTVFCEGARGGDRDESFYRAWFGESDTAVIPVGSSKRVQQCVEVVNSGETIRGGSAIGIIDRDYWPEQYLHTVVDGIHVLKVHEVEGLLCLPEVFTAVARYVKVSEDKIPHRYNSFLEKARNYFHGPALNKQILERAKRRVEAHTISLLNSVAVNPDLASLRSSFEAAMQPANWAFEPSQIFTEEEIIVMSALRGSPLEFLGILPAKSYFAHAAAEIGVTPDRYLEIVVAGLIESGKPETGESRLHEQLIAALRDHLPLREKKAEVEHDH